MNREFIERIFWLEIIELKLVKFLSQKLLGTLHIHPQSSHDTEIHE